ncbi:MAG: hypothetical protein K9N62_05345 [Verrucomicrobia bacterium]|nr:hypothetical protein [Verrucomicrobiota bacterium]
MRTRIRSLLRFSIPLLGRRTNSIAVFDLRDGYARNISVRVQAGDSFPEGRYLEASVRRAPDSPWHGNRSYVDLLYPGVTEKFLEVTLEPYRREFAASFGNRVPGVFTDEPEIRSAGGLPWTEDLPGQFERRWGYSLTDHLPGLTLPVGDWRRLRHNYFQTLNDLFIERWARPYFDYCKRTGLEMTGHYWEHEWPRCLSVPDNMAMYAWQQRPAIDTLMNHYEENTHAQFGNVRAVRELSSIANQLGLSRTLCEIYGAAGWDLRFEDMKRIGDWLQVLGVNTLNEHLSYVTLRGARKRDHPQSFSHHEPWWEAYHVSASYFTRLSAALSHGQQVNRVLVLEPTTTAWMHQGDESSLKGLGDSFTGLLMDLEKAQIEYDLGCEDVIARHGSATSTGLRIGQRTYPIVVLPPRTENLNLSTVVLLEKFVANDGRVLACGAPPGRLDGEPSDRAAALARLPGWTTLESRNLPGSLIEPESDFQVTRTPGDSGILFHHRRQFEDGQMLFLVNTSDTHPSSGTVQAKAGGIEAWDLHTGKTAPHPFESDNGRVRSPFTLPPSGSLLLFLTLKPIDSPGMTSTETVRINADGPPQVQRLQPNVLTLDYVDITAGGSTRTNVYFYEANAWVWRQHGLERNPWDSAVQFQDELISKHFPADSGFTAVYRFTVDGPVPSDLAIVIERPDLYALECNGKPLKGQPGSWWLDRAFGKIPLAGHARSGENSVRITAKPFSMLHELEPAYVIGNFSLRPEPSGFVIQPAEPMSPGPWNEQGQPFYGHTVGYAGT